MTQVELIERANGVIDRLFALDEEIANARAFRALLENLNRRDLTIVKEPHVRAITMVRAGILRSAIGSVMACLDYEDRRGNRASVGQILHTLMDAKLVAVFPEPGSPSDPRGLVLQEVRSNYDSLIKDDLFQRGKRLRNDAVAHKLIPDDPTPEVSYETIYRLHDAAERFLIGLYQVCGRGTPRFLSQEADLVRHAKVFWDTYFIGMKVS